MVLVPTVHCNGSNITGSSGTLNASGDSSGIDSGT